MILWFPRRRLQPAELALKAFAISLVAVVGTSRICVELGNRALYELYQLAAATGVDQLVPQCKSVAGGAMDRRFMRPRIFWVRAIFRLGRSNILQLISDHLNARYPPIQILAPAKSQHSRYSV